MTGKCQSSRPLSSPFGLRNVQAVSTGPSVLGSVQKLASAFSLIEIVLALGIISFALVGIMGLFPVAMKSAQESQRETRATQIAQQIFSDLKAVPGTNRLVAITTNILNTQSSINLTTSGSIAVSYDREGRPLGIGTNHTERIFLADIQVTANSPMAGLSRVQTTIETPALAATNARSKYTFVTLMNQQ